MLFNSVEFALFLPIVFLIYWFVVNRNLRIQNVFLLIASYIFYGWWDWRFLFLLFSISLFNYFIGIRIDKNESNTKRERWLIAGLTINIGVLAIFKYYNFFINSFIDLVSLSGYDLPESGTKIILPIGISFYTFLSISYILDIYRKTLNADRNIIHVLLSLSFFPIILAGPIQRPATLLPQIRNLRDFNYKQAVDGLRQIIWGLFMKIILADNLASYTDEIFSNFYNYSGSTLLLGAIFFSIQIYTDFSGYSNIAIGTAKLFGFNLMQNFAYPYFARDITEFWRRWHISLTTWFRDYIFLPLSINMVGKIKTEKVLSIPSDIYIYIIVSIVVWFLTGLWHGANYTYIIWGMFHGFFLIIYRLQSKPRTKLFKKIGIKNNHPSVVIIETLITLCIVIIAFILFRAESINHALNYLSIMFSASLFDIPIFYGRGRALFIIILALLFFISEWIGRGKQFALADLEFVWPKPFRWVFYSILLIIIYLFGNYSETIEFIYFQF